MTNMISDQDLRDLGNIEEMLQVYCGRRGIPIPTDPEGSRIQKLYYLMAAVYEEEDGDDD